MFRDFNLALEKAKNRVLTYPASTSRLLEVHPSQIPICPTSFILDFNTDLYYSKTLTSSLTLDCGTKVHEIMQDYLSYDKTMFGNYVCPNCGIFFELTTGGKLCPDCHSPLRYLEIPINYDGFSGHVDCIIKSKDDKYYLVDFKTTGSNTIDKKVKNTPFEYQLQTLSYAYLLWAQYKIRIREIAICYINRDNFNDIRMGYYKKVTKENLKKIRKLLYQQKELKEFLLNCKSYKEFMENVGIQKCTNPYCKYCKLKNVNSLLRNKFEQLGGKSIKEYIDEHNDKQDNSGKAI